MTAESIGIKLDAGSGGWLAFFGRRGYFGDPKRFLEQVVARNGRAAAFRFAGNVFYVFTDPDLVEHVLLRAAGKYDKGPVLKNLREFFGSGIFTAEGETWRERRRALTPAFAREALAGHERDVTEATGAWLDRRLAAGGPVEIEGYQAMLDLTREIMIKILFGAGASDEETQEAVAAGKAFDEVNRFFQYTLTRTGVVLSRLPGLRRWKYLRAVAVLDRMMARHLRKPAAEARGLLALLRSLEPDETHIRDHVLALYFGGHESTASTLTSALWMGLANPEALARLVAAVRGGDGGDTLDAFLNETLRLHPPVWCLARRAIRDNVVTYQGREHTVRRGSLVFIPTWSIHRDPELYPEAPLAFDPARWAGVDPGSRRRGTFLPFGLGPRMCIGAGVAWMELRVILRLLLTRCDVGTARPLPPYETTGALTIRPRAPLRLTLKHAG